MAAFRFPARSWGQEEEEGGVAVAVQGRMGKTRVSVNGMMVMASRKMGRVTPSSLFPERQALTLPHSRKVCPPLFSTAVLVSPTQWGSRTWEVLPLRPPLEPGMCSVGAVPLGQPEVETTGRGRELGRGGEA